MHDNLPIQQIAIPWVGGRSRNGLPLWQCGVKAIGMCRKAGKMICAWAKIMAKAKPRKIECSVASQAGPAMTPPCTSAKLPLQPWSSHYVAADSLNRCGNLSQGGAFVSYWPNSRRLARPAQSRARIRRPLA